MNIICVFCAQSITESAAFGIGDLGGALCIYI